MRLANEVTVACSNSASNNGTYTVSSVTNSGRTIEIVTTMLTDEANNSGAVLKYRDPNNDANEISLVATNFGNLSFDRANDRITSNVANALNNIPVGARITIANTTNNIKWIYLL